MSWFVDPAWSTLAAWFEAIGTIGAVLVALFYQPLINWWKRPIIKIEFKNDEPYCRIADLMVHKNMDNIPVLFKTYFIRLKIVNTGRSTAKKCKGKITNIKHSEKNEVFTPFDPLVLKWVGHQPGSIDLNKDEYEFLNLLYVIKNNPKQINLHAEDTTPRGINLNPPMDNYNIEVVVYGENFSSEKILFKFISGPEFFNVKLEKAKSTLQAF